MSYNGDPRELLSVAADLDRRLDRIPGITGPDYDTARRRHHDAVEALADELRTRPHARAIVTAAVDEALIPAILDDE